MIIEPAGYVVHDTGAYLIHGYGASEEAAWADALNTMQHAMIELIGEDEDTDNLHGSWMHLDELKTIPATAALLQLVEDHGGNCNWEKAQGVACTDDEARIAASQEMA